MGLIILGKQVEIKISLLSAEKIALRRYFFRKEKLDELRLNNFILDKLLVLCYTMYTVKRKEVIKMATDYKSFTNAELSEQIEKMRAELHRRENIEKEQRWEEVCNILHKWFRDYGEITIDTSFIPEITINKEDDYSTISEIHITYGE